MRRLLRAVTIGAAAAGLLVGCTGATTQTGLATAWQALIQVGTQFVAVGETYKGNCLPGPRQANLAGFCAGFRAFTPKFQASYPLAVDTWKTAVKAKDIAAAQGAEATILGLASDLAAIAGQALQGLGGR